MTAASYVLVGYDGLPASEHALRWAAEEARLRGLELRVVHAWHWPYPADYDDYQVRAIARRTGERVLDRGAALARRMAPAVRVRMRLMDGPPHAALMFEGHGAELIAVGLPEQGGAPVGSTALRLPARSHRPVVAVRTSGFEHAVVCVDGADGGESALAFAFEQAAMRGWRLDAVCGYRDSDAVEAAGSFDEDELRRAAAARLEQAVRPWLEKYRVNVRLEVLPKTPHEAMVEAAASAGLVVVGNRSVTGLDPLSPTATSGALLRNAPCTVAVVWAE